MKIQDVMRIEENLLWITILMLLTSGLIFSDDNFIQVSIFFAFNILYYGNLRRLVQDKETAIQMFVRRGLYIVPLLLPFIMGFQLALSTDYLGYWMLGAFLFGLLPILFKIRDWSIFLNYDIISLQQKFSKEHYCSMVMILFGLTIAEEIFFRNFIIQFLRESLGIFSVFLSGFMFMLHHFSCKWGRKSFRKTDFVLQFFLGSFAAILYYFSRSIIPPIIFHLTYNSPHILFNLRSYFYFYIMKKELHS